MNGFEAPALASGIFGSYDSNMNGLDSRSPEPLRSKAKSGAKALTFVSFALMNRIR